MTGEFLKVSGAGLAGISQGIIVTHWKPEFYTVTCGVVCLIVGCLMGFSGCVVAARAAAAVAEEEANRR